MALSASQYQLNALALVGAAPVDAIFELILPLATEGGTFAITYEDEETADLAWNTDAATLEAALEALETIGVGGVAVEGVRQGPYYIQLTGANGGQAAGSMTADGSNLDPPAGLALTEVQQGRPSRLASSALTFWNKYEGTTDLDLRYLYMARDLCVEQMGRQSNRVDARDGDEEVKESGVGLNLQRILAEIRQQIKDTIAVQGQSTGTVFAGEITRGRTVRDNYSIRKNVTGRVG